MSRETSAASAEEVEEMVSREVGETIDDIVLRVVAKGISGVAMQRAAAAAFIRHGGLALAKLASDEDADREMLKNSRRHRVRAARDAHKTRRGVL